MIKHFRPGTVDEQIIKETYEYNNYRLPENMLGMVFVDIGAHIGSASILAAEREATVYAYEPERENFKLLIKNVSESKLPINIHKAAVGKPGMRKLYVNPNNSGGNSLRLEWTDFGQDENIFEEVRVVSLHELMGYEGIEKIDILKLDCEGAEEEIFTEIRAGLNGRVEEIVAELHFPDRNDEIVEQLCEFYTHEKIGKHQYRFRSRYGNSCFN